MLERSGEAQHPHAKRTCSARTTVAELATAIFKGPLAVEKETAVGRNLRQRTLPMTSRKTMTTRLRSSTRQQMRTMSPMRMKNMRVPTMRTTLWRKKVSMLLKKMTYQTWMIPNGKSATPRTWTPGDVSLSSRQIVASTRHQCSPRHQLPATHSAQVQRKRVQEQGQSSTAER